jgi:arylsulfatase A-like enzyme
MSRPNIIFVVADALRAKNMSCYGYSKETTPHLSKLATDGVLFENAYSTITATDPSLTSIFSGYYPVTHGILNHGNKVATEEIQHFTATKIELLPEILCRIGYSTYALDWLGRWHRRGYMYYLGSLYDSKKTKMEYSLSNILNKIPVPTVFRKNLKKLYYSIFGHPSHLMTAEQITAEAIKIIENNVDNHFFLFIHYWDTHNIYNPGKFDYKKFVEDSAEICQEPLKNVIKTMDPKYKEFLLNAYGNKTVGEIIGMYNAAIRNIDEEIRKIHKVLQKNGIKKNTLFIFTADHGESLNEHGIYFEHEGLYNETVHVPLIISYPEQLPKGKRLSIDVQHIDIVPTILSILGYSHNNVISRIDGMDLIPYIFDEKELPDVRIILFEEHEHEDKIGIKYGKYKYIEAVSKEGAICRRCRVLHGDYRELYDLNTDKNEEVSVVNKYPELSRELRKLLIKYRESKKDKANSLVIKNKLGKLGSVTKV